MDGLRTVFAAPSTRCLGLEPDRKEDVVTGQAMRHKTSLRFDVEWREHRKLFKVLGWKRSKLHRAESIRILGAYTP